MSDIMEKIGILSATTKAAHARIDKVENEIRDDLKALHSELKELNAYMNRGKGWAAAFVLISGLVGASTFKLIAYIFNK